MRKPHLIVALDEDVNCSRKYKSFATLAVKFLQGFGLFNSGIKYFFTADTKNLRGKALPTEKSLSYRNRSSLLLDLLGKQIEKLLSQITSRYLLS